MNRRFCRPGRGLAVFLAFSLIFLQGAPVWPRSGRGQKAKRVLSGHSGWINSVAFSADDQVLATAGNDNTIRLWDVRTGKQTRVIRRHFDAVRALAFSPDNTSLASASDDGTVRLWDPAAGRQTGEHPALSEGPWALGFSADGVLVAAGSAGRKVLLWRAGKGWKERALRGHKKDVMCLALSPDGKLLASGSADSTIRLWDVGRGKKRKVLKGHSGRVTAVAFSEDGRTLVSAGGGRELLKWDVATGAHEPLVDWSGAVVSAAFSPDGRMVALGYVEKQLVVLDIERKAPALREYAGVVKSIAFSSDGEYLASGGTDPGVRLLALSRSLRAPKPKSPPQLSVKVEFHEPGDGDGVLDAGEEAWLSVAVENRGEGPAYHVAIEPRLLGKASGISVPSRVRVGTVAPGKTIVRRVPVSASRGVPTRTVRVRVAVREGNDFDAAPQVVELRSRKLRAPRLVLAGVSVGAGRVVRKGEYTDAAVTLANDGEAPARDVRASLKVGSRKIFWGGDLTAELGSIDPGRSKTANFRFFVKNGYRGKAALPITLSVTESQGRYGIKGKSLGLVLGKSPEKIVIAGRGNVDIPPNARTPRDPEAYAVVIGVENYRNVPSVDYAARDAQVMRNYLIRAMGFKTENVVLLQNETATKSDMEKNLERWLRNQVSRKSRVFVYFAGHGSPNQKTREGYLIPYNGDPAYLDSTAYPVRRLFDSLARLPSRDVTVVLDACFTGTGGRSTLPKGVRPLVVSLKGPPVGQNTTFLSAAGWNEISTYSRKGRHGLLTYHLLRGLKGAADADKNKRITTGELFDYVRPKVRRDARRQNVRQTPTLKTGRKRGKRSRVWMLLK